MRTFFIVLGSAAFAFTAFASPASAYLVSIDRLTVIKNTNTVLDDQFDTNTPPPEGPDGADTYGINGTFSEANGVATMTTATGSPNIFGGTSFIRHNANFLTNTQPLATSTNGLKSDDTLSVQGLFDVFIPATNRESYGVYFTDRLGPGGSLNTGNDQLEMRLVRTSLGEVRLQFQRVNHVTQTNTGIQSILLLDAVGGGSALDVTNNDTLLLQLFKLSDSSNDITASYEYFDFETNTTFTNTFANTAAIFHDEDFTRAGFFARVARGVPEPGMLALFGIGLVGLGFAKTRRKAAGHSA